jgi:hypothetical protein
MVGVVIDWIKVGVVQSGELNGGPGAGPMFATGEHGCADARSVVEEVLRDEAEVMGLEIDPAWLKEQMWRLLQMFQDARGKSEPARAASAGFVYQMELPSGRTIIMGEPVVLDQVNLLH